MKILIIEDEKKISDFLKTGLKAEGYIVTTSGDGEEGLARALEESYELIVLDLKLPKQDGISVCRALRAKGKTMPIIMLTAKDTVEDRVKGLDAGADDYLIKPFFFEELLARIRALTRRNKTTTETPLTVGDLVMDAEHFEIKRGGKSILLSATEFKLLKFLMENKERIVSKTRILENVWGYDFSPESNIVDVYIKYLRDKIDKTAKKKLIQTVHGMGYKLCASD